MRTNIEIDDKLMQAVLKETGLPTKRAAVEEALKLLLRQKRRRAVLDLFGKVDWQGDLEKKPPLVIAVDSSVWIDHLCGNATPEVRKLFDLVQSDADIVVGDLVLCEVLSGVPTDRAAARVEERLRRFEVVTMTGPAIAVEAAAHYRRLRSKGVTIRKTIDLLIATFCIVEDLALLHRDRDFDAIEQHLGLRVMHA